MGTGVIATPGGTVTNPSAPTTVYPPQTTVAVGGMVNGAAGTQALVRVWLASAGAPYQKDLSSGHEVQVGYLPPIPLMGVAAPYTFPAIPLAQNAANYFVVTVSDQYGNGESLPVPVPVITQGTAVVQGGYSATITSPATPLTVYPPLTTTAISGTATGPAGSQGLVRIWKADPMNPYSKDFSTGSEVQVGSVLVTLTGYPVAFTIPNVPLQQNTTNYFVATGSDQYGNNESMPLPVQPITQTAQMAQVLVVRKPSAPRLVEEDSYTIRGQAAPNSLVQIWSSDEECEKRPGGHALGAAQLTGSETHYAITIPLTRNRENRFVVTAISGGVESAPVPVPTLTHRSPHEEMAEEVIVEEVTEEGRIEESRVKPRARAAGRRQADESLDR